MKISLGIPYKMTEYCFLSNDGGSIILVCIVVYAMVSRYMTSTFIDLWLLVDIVLDAVSSVFQPFVWLILWSHSYTCAHTPKLPVFAMCVLHVLCLSFALWSHTQLNLYIYVAVCIRALSVMLYLFSVYEFTYVVTKS